MKNNLSTTYINKRRTPEFLDEIFDKLDFEEVEICTKAVKRRGRRLFKILQANEVPDIRYLMCLDALCEALGFEGNYRQFGELMKLEKRVEVRCRILQNLVFAPSKGFEGLKIHLQRKLPDLTIDDDCLKSFFSEALGYETWAELLDACAVLEVA